MPPIGDRGGYVIEGVGVPPIGDRGGYVIEGVSML